MPASASTDSVLMRRALELAALGGSAVRPNPLVGCVIADAAGHILAEGWHQRYGGPHAEVNAVAALFARPNAPPDLRGLRVFVTLEPCVHHGKTPPCTDLLLRHGATEVHIATLDPNPLVGGRGAEKLRAAGCNVRVGVLEAESRWLNRRFFTAQQTRRPWVVLKWAQSADGFLADATGSPTPITGEVSRRLVHRWRTEEAAILIGATTARLDNPRLDARHWSGPAPIRVVLTGQQAISTSLRMFTDGGAPVLTFDGYALPLPVILADLLTRGLHSVLVEGGAAVLQAFLAADLWDEIRILTNPVLQLRAGTPAPHVPAAMLYHQSRVGDDEVREYFQQTSPTVAS
ncbi:MAG: bifunctional diaminohydroxyphosphoribosylaminopyrimidine deaminase/5-amino-6-(5-phosphoribosylamino)uracil reductase RibD [Hymenobacteraceae bacterium]|nr:bifunctional diaminohydroxyphosphoribosylaminopyrimidine deaminase/5-amino-6-(5-phosphoribosylamino)uracil reductase RibD [Hymenobacteraceae bacterium]